MTREINVGSALFIVVLIDTIRSTESGVAVPVEKEVRLGNIIN